MTFVMQDADMTDVLIYGDTIRSADMRHEIPLVVPDPFPYALIAAIDAYLTANNTNPRPFIWTCSTGSALHSRARSRAR